MFRATIQSDKNIIAALSNFCDSLLDMYAKTHNEPVLEAVELFTAPAGSGQRL